MEGFRVLPYGEPTDDWLQLDRGVAERGRWSSDPESELTSQLNKAEQDANAGLNHLPNKHYFGAVFLTERYASELRMLVNREGFIPNQAFTDLTKIVRTGIDLSTRVQMAASQRKRIDRRIQRQTSDGGDSRRRRSRQVIADRFETGVKLIASSAERQGIKILNKIPHDFQSPPMFAAELTTVFSNLLSNAVKAAGPKGTIRATARQRSNGTVTLRVENTGLAVKVRDRERFFQPFESTTTKVDTVLGQGMGLGLTITRAMLEEYGAMIKFVEPTGGFATAVEIVFPE
jgi:anti-sigma regulatory factor (Ser/Thr protein kinase)